MYSPRESLNLEAMDFQTRMSDPHVRHIVSLANKLLDDPDVPDCNINEACDAMGAFRRGKAPYAATRDCLNAMAARFPGVDPEDKQILVTMLTMGATSSAARGTRDDIARKADDLATGSDIGNRIAGLCKNGYVASKRGPGGGCWLTVKGIAAAK